LQTSLTLHSIEDRSDNSANDAALGKTAALAGVMPSMRADAGLSALIGQEAVEWTSKSIQALTEARRAIVETHKELTVAQKQIGLGAVMFGDPIKPEMEAGGRILHEVPAAGARAAG